MAFAYEYQLMTKSAIDSYLTNKVLNDSVRRNMTLDDSVVAYVVRVLMEDVALGYADSTINKKCSKLLTLIAS